jgi:hypothetical protein
MRTWKLIWVKTHYGGGSKMLSHCIVFQGCPCLNSNHGNIKAYFSKPFHNMVDYNTKSLITKIFFFPNLYCEVPKYISNKKMYVITY